MRNQREGRQGQHFIENKECEEVGRHGDAHRAKQGDGKAHIEARLVALLRTAHIADGIEAVDDPEPAGDECEHRAERLQLEGEIEAGHHGAEIRFRRRARCNSPRQQTGDDEEQRGAHKCHAFANVRHLTGKPDTASRQKRQDQGCEDQGFTTHDAPPMNRADAASSARP